jgi:hypothetical protein
MDIQAIFRDIDTNEALFHDPSLRMRSHCADRATVRVHRNDERGARLIYGLKDQDRNGLPLATAAGIITLPARC